MTGVQTCALPISICGISVFDSSFDRGRRRDIFLDRRFKKYQKLEELVKKGNSRDIENCLRKIIGEHQTLKTIFL